MRQYRIVQKTSNFSVITYVIQKHSWFRWENILMDNYANEIAAYQSFIEAKKHLELLCFIPVKDVVIYKHWK